MKMHEIFAFLGGASKTSASMVSFVEMSSLVENKYGRTEHSQHYQFKWLSSTPARSQELGSRQPKVYLPFLFSVLAGRGMYEWQDLHLETVAPRLRGGWWYNLQLCDPCLWLQFKPNLMLIRAHRKAGSC